MKAVLCPVCNGSGKVGLPSPPESPELEGPCHGCEGKGWVAVPEDEVKWVPNPPHYTWTSSNPCLGCQWYNKPYWSVVSPCEYCPRRGFPSTTVTWSSNSYPQGEE